MNRKQVLKIRNKLSELSDEEVLDFCNSYTIFEIKNEIIENLVKSSNEIIADIKLGIKYIVENRMAIEEATAKELLTYDDTNDQLGDVR